MGSTFLSLHYHVVFGTKSRAPIIADEFQGRVHAYIGGTIRRLGGVAEAVGGVADHVHVLMGLRATDRLSDVIRDLKRSTTPWIRRELGLNGFRWQEGYGAFTVSAADRSQVRAYIANQKEHHRATSFREEMIALLKRAGLETDVKWLDV